MTYRRNRMCLLEAFSYSIESEGMEFLLPLLKLESYLYHCLNSWSLSIFP
ncbi:hypothetical protein KC19_10G175200 [Ceratodon purpureus]|uniref:Uncharacterized protein n=1 Tax=Ceratodon purpureus TaxID=3225 RepID=A0A8T0GQ76_CERPU|nr:hypothetical protein KC19_10G175200 [Ceratodon purpureus]